MVDAGWVMTGSWPIDTEMERGCALVIPPLLHRASIWSAVPVLRESNQSEIGAKFSQSYPFVSISGYRVLQMRELLARMPFLPALDLHLRSFPVSPGSKKRAESR